MSGYTLLGLVHVSGLVRSKGGLLPKKLFYNSYYFCNHNIIIFTLISITVIENQTNSLSFRCQGFLLRSLPYPVWASFLSLVISILLTPENDWQFLFLLRVSLLSKTFKLFDIVKEISWPTKESHYIFLVLYMYHKECID